MPSFFVITPSKNGLVGITNGNKVSKCCPFVAKIGVGRKRKTPKSLFYNNIGVLFCGATGIRTRDTRIFSPLLDQLSYGTIMLCLTFLKRVQR